MILSDKDIAKGLDEGRTSTDPMPETSQIQPASLDIRMGHTIVDVAEGRDIGPVGKTHRLHPGRFYLGETLESVSIPNDLTAQIANRSTFARDGLIAHLVAGYVDPGWSGKLTLEMLNVSTTPVNIDVGERVVQLVFQETKSESSGYEGQYKGATGPEGPGGER